MKCFWFSPFPIALILIAFAVSLCSGCYTLKQGTTMLGYLGRAIPLEDLSEQSSAQQKQRAKKENDPANQRFNDELAENIRFVNQVTDIRRFAMEELGLKESKNYTRYVELDRNYLAAVVSASQKDSFNRYEWWFPVVGKVPYKGFFNIEDARKERKKLEKKDLDVWIRGVDAFSTLGWFKDPLYSYMKNYPPRELAELIIHELLHATVYLNNHSQFNEELAEFVGSEGARLYMVTIVSEEPNEESINDFNEELIKKRSDEAAEDYAAFLNFIRNLIAELDHVYKNQSYSRTEKLTRKADIIAKAQSLFEETYEINFKTENYRNFSSMEINNAYLELYRLYHERSSWFEDLYEKSGKDLKAYIAAAKTLKGKEDPQAEFKRALGVQ